MQEKSLKQNLGEKLASEFGRRDFLRGIGAGAAAMGATALLGPNVAMAQAKKGGTLRWGQVVPPDTLDPHFTGSLGAIRIHNNIYNGLLKVVYDGKKVDFVPDLASSWTMEDDKTHIFKIRPNVKFHDGEPCDAAAVKWSIERVKDPKTGSPHAWMLQALDGVDIVDPLTVRIRYKTPFAFFPISMNGGTGRAGTIVSRKAVEKYGKEFGRNPVGTGPFKFVQWRENEMIELVRNPDYFEPGLPYLDKIHIQLIKEPTAAAAAIMSGQVDALDMCPLQFMPQMRSNKNLQIFGEVEGNYTFVGMNNKRAPFDDVNLRLAVAYAIDRELLIKQCYFGEGIVARTLMSPPMKDFYDPNVAKTGRGQFFDLEKAKAYRAKAKNQGEVQAVYVAAEGFTSQGGSGSRTAQLVIPMLAKIGIKAKLELMDVAVLNKRTAAGDFDLYDAAWESDLDPDEAIRPEWSTGMAWNRVGYSNPEFDELVKNASLTVNVAERKKLYEKAEDIILQKDAPMAVLGHLRVSKILSNKLEGFKYVPSNLMNMHTVSLKS